MWSRARGFDAPRRERDILQTCVRFLRQSGSYSNTCTALRGLCPTADQDPELNEFFVWSELTWFQLKAASRKAALNFSDGSSQAGTSSSDTIERRDVASRLNLSTVVEESLIAYQTRHGESFPVPAELSTFLDQVRKSRPIWSRLQRYVLELGAEFEECLAIQKKQVTKNKGKCAAPSTAKAKAKAKGDGKGAAACAPPAAPAMEAVDVTRLELESMQASIDAAVENNSESSSEDGSESGGSDSD
jgi:hypothetical protein